VKAAPVALTPAHSRQAAFQAIARACLRQLVANQAATLAATQKDCTRCGLLCGALRAAISLFGDMLLDPQTEEVKTQLRWITQNWVRRANLTCFIKRVVRPVTDASRMDQERRCLPGASAKTRGCLWPAPARLSNPRAFAILFSTRRPGSRLAADAQHRRSHPLAARTTDCVCCHDELRRRWKKIMKVGAQLHALDPQRRHKMAHSSQEAPLRLGIFAGAFLGKKATRRRRISWPAWRNCRTPSGT